MLKKFTSCFLLLFSVVFFAQENKVWELLLNNKREEARVLFDKEFSATKKNTLELLFLDAVIEEELGQLNFDESFLKDFAKLNDNINYLYPMSTRRMILGDLADYGIDDLTYKKIDYLAALPSFANNNFVQQYKVEMDRARKNTGDPAIQLAKVNRIDQWQRTGVFENLNGSGLDIEYEPEFYAKNDKLFDAGINGKVQWYKPKYTLKDGFEYFENESEYGTGILYVQSFVENPTERNILLETNTESNYKVFLNDIEVFSTLKDGYSSRGSHTVQLLLPKGMNRIVLKIELKNSNTSFLSAIFDTNYKKFNDLKYFSDYKNYVKSSLAQLAPKEVELPYEQLLKQKLQEHPDNIFYKFLLISGYLHTGKNEDGNKLLEELQKNYPQSSMLNVLKLKYYSNIQENTKIKQVQKVLQSQDPSYYLVPLIKLQETEWIENATAQDFQTQSAVLKKTMAIAFADLFDAIAAMKDRNLEVMKRKVDSFKKNTFNNEKFFSSFTMMQNSDKVDQSYNINSFESFLAKKISIADAYILANLYEKSNRLKDAEKLYTEYITVFPANNILRKELARLLSENLKDPQIEFQLDEALANYPYSFTVLAQKAELLAHQNKKEEALKTAEKALSYDAGNSSMLKLQKDLRNKEDLLEKSTLQDVKSLIAERRTTATRGTSGVTVLYDEYIVQVAAEGGYKGKSTYLFLVTSAKGIEEMKEYETGNEIVKAEIVKEDGTIIPGEISYSSAVFANIEIGDVVYIQSTTSGNQEGRFYKDFHVSSYFQSGFPTLESVFTLITPENMAYKIKTNKTKVNSTTKNINNNKYETWRMKDVPELIIDETYAPDFYDEAKSITVGSIKSWKEIADWYADLSKNSIVADKTTEKAFAEIFPDGIKGFSDYEKASKIYNFIQSRINYSSVDFRQSGYIPQKPSKTLVTNLGDCKDLSALFVILGKQAGLVSNMVLVQTNDNSEANFMLPNITFNHCIVRLKLGDQYTFVEMTDKNLPFNAIAKSLYKAKALLIDYDKKSDGEIINIPVDNNEQEMLKTVTDVNLEDGKTYITTQFVQGQNKSFYNDFFTEEGRTEEDRKKFFEESFGSVLNETVVVKKVNLQAGKDLSKTALQFQVNYNVNTRIQKVGNMKIVKVPFVTRPFNRQIIAAEVRKQDIIYRQYEDQREYKEEITIKLPANAKFVELPTPAKYQFKNFRYEISYKLITDGKLLVTRSAVTPWDNISATDYKEYKIFVEQIMEAEDQLLGYK